MPPVRILLLSASFANLNKNIISKFFNFHLLFCLPHLVQSHSQPFRVNSYCVQNFVYQTSRSPPFVLRFPLSSLQRKICFLRPLPTILICISELIPLSPLLVLLLYPSKLIECSCLTLTTFRQNKDHQFTLRENLKSK